MNIIYTNAHYIAHDLDDTEVQTVTSPASMKHTRGTKWQPDGGWQQENGTNMNGTFASMHLHDTINVLIPKNLE